MAISVTKTNLPVKLSEIGQRIRFELLKVTGLTAATANTIAHGLPNKPLAVVYIPTGQNQGFETSDPDHTNIYFTTASGQTSLKAIVWY
jgi:hypothetical protein